MKPTRADLVRVLAERRSNRLQAAIKDVEAKLQALPMDKTDYACRDAAVVKFMQRSTIKRLIAELDAAGVEYTVSGTVQEGTDPSRSDKTVCTVNCSLQIKSPAALKFRIRLNAKQRKAQEALHFQRTNLQRQRSELTSQLYRLKEDSTGREIIGDVISKLLIEKDNKLQELLQSLESRLDTALTVDTQ